VNAFCPQGQFVGFAIGAKAETDWNNNAKNTQKNKKNLEFSTISTTYHDS
jgi:hypothetical protein